MWNFRAHLLIYVKNLQDNHPLKRLRKSLRIDFQFPGNWFKIGIIFNDFSSSKIWDTQIQISFTVFRNPKNPGIHPSHKKWVIFNSLLILNGFDWFDYSFARIVQSETCVTVTDPSLELLEQIEKFIFKIANKRWLLIDCYQNKIQFVLIKLRNNFGHFK